MNSSSQKRCYSWRYGTWVVDQFLSKHQKTVDLVNESFKTNITSQMLVKIFCYNQPKWNNFKAMIKRILRGQLADVWLEHHDLPETTKQVLSIFGGTLQKVEKGQYFNHHEDLTDLFD